MRVALLFSNTLVSNTPGPGAGLAFFGILFCVFLGDWRRSERLRSCLSAIAAALGTIWNFGNLLVLLPGFSQRPAFHVVHALAYSALGFFPAVLLHIWLQQRYRYLCIGGYLLSLGSAILQIREELTTPSLAGQSPLLLIAIGFSSLTIICLCQSLRQPGSQGSEWYLAAAMLLLLPAIFLISHDSSRTRYFHYLGIPLSLLVMLFDFRFLILDALSRFFLKASLMIAGIVLTLFVPLKFPFGAHDPFRAALALVTILGGLIAIAQPSRFVERLETWFLRRRSRFDHILATLRDYPLAEKTGDEYLDHARRSIQALFQCEVGELRDLLQFPELEDSLGPSALRAGSRLRTLNPAIWAEAALPLHFSTGEGRVLLLGPRRGHRPYRHEDFLFLARFGKIIEHHIERRRQLQNQALASHAELRVLQAQINPHFFFNSLNTLYAVISRDNLEARRLVLNLTEVFHYLLRSDRTFVSLKQELAIIDAYLEIEKLRLGPRLTTSIQIEQGLLEAEIPVLSLQPLVENAVKHGVVPYSENGFVGLTVKSEGARLKIEVANTGTFGANRSLSGAGVGLDNVQRRLALCYGFEAKLHISSKKNLTLVCCSMPLSTQVSNGYPKPVMKSTTPSRIMRKTA